MGGMVDVFVFHHALGVTPGVEAFAARLRHAGHRVETPDLYDGRVFSHLADGVAHAESIGFDAIAHRGAELVAAHAEPVAAIGFSLGALPAQRAAQTLPQVTTAVLCHSAIPLGWFGDTWPGDVSLQLHLGRHDPWAAEDLDAATELAAASGGELHFYDTDRHLVCDDSTADHDPTIAAQITERILRMLGRPGDN
jgi:dienelactone hydrolase